MKNDYGISCIFSASVSVFRNEDKLVALLAYSTFRRVTTIQRNCVFTSGGRQVIQAERK